MLRRLAIFAVLLAAAGTTAVVQSAPASAAGILSSNITSPANGAHYLITDVSPATTVTVEGTTSGGTAGDLVDIRCYEARGQWESNGAVSGVPATTCSQARVAAPVSRMYFPASARNERRSRSMAGSYEMAGLWAVWHAVHAPSSACSRTTTWGKPGGLPPLRA